MNVLFNLLRGGTVAMATPSSERTSLSSAIQETNGRRSGRSVRGESPVLPETLTLQALKTWAAESKCPDYQRLALEYLPITFSRRHGDPSRPWNQFDIKIHNGMAALTSTMRVIGGTSSELGSIKPCYPGFIESMICKFLNATTADGYNPYRLTSLGIDWEAPNPDDPWSNMVTGAIIKSSICSNSLSYPTIYIPMASRICSWHLSLVMPTYPTGFAYDDLLKDPRDSIEFLPDLDQALTTAVKRWAVIKS